MAAGSGQRTSIDRLTLVEEIRRVFARSPIFRDAVISHPSQGPGGEVTVDLRCDHRPTVLRVTAPSDEEAFAILHELVSAMVEIERDPRVSFRA